MGSHETPQYDLLIIGAGPVGLATALSAHRRGCRSVAVVDQTSAFKRAGDGVLVPSNGTRALRIFAPELADKLCVLPSYQTPFRMMNVSGDVLDDVKVPPQTAEHGMPTEPGSLGAHWYTVQRMLLEALPDCVHVHTDTQFVGMEEEGDGLRVDFVRGRVRINPFAQWYNDPASVSNSAMNTSEEDPVRVSMRTRILIGADGINSSVREVLDSQIERSAHFYGFVSVKCQTTMTEHILPHVQEMDRIYLPNKERMAVVGCMPERAREPDAPNVMLVRMHDEEKATEYGFHLKLIMHVAVPKHIAFGEREPFREAVVTMLHSGNYPECIVRLAHALLEPGEDGEKRKVAIRPFFIVPIADASEYKRPHTASKELDEFQPTTGAGRVFLAGDALHATPVFLAQGMAMGFEDVVELVDALAAELRWGGDQHVAPSLDVLERVRELYKRARVPRMARVQRETLTRRWAWDGDGYVRTMKWMHDFVPMGEGWRKSARDTQPCGVADGV